MPSSTLIQRFTYGNFADPSLFRREAGVPWGVSERQRELIALAKVQIAAQREATAEIVDAQLACTAILTKELQQQTARLEATIKAGADAVVTALDDLGDRIAGELVEIRWELVQLRAVSEQILAVLKRPRSTEARELLQQGVRNLINDKIAQAEERFTLALRLDNTDYQVLMNLASVELHKGESERAIAYIRDALTLPADLDNRSKADALWSLARLHYARERYGTALKIAQESLRFFSEPQRIFQRGVYSVLAGRVTEGLNLVVSAIREDRNLFAVAASSPDLGAHRRAVLNLLDKLSGESLDRLSGGLAAVARELDTTRQLDAVPPELIEALRAKLEALRRTIPRSSYSELCTASEKLSSLHRAPKLIAAISNTVAEIGAAEQAKVGAAADAQKAAGRLRFIPGQGLSGVLGCLVWLVTFSIIAATAGAIFGMDSLPRKFTFVLGMLWPAAWILSYVAAGRLRKNAEVADGEARTTLSQAEARVISAHSRHRGAEEAAKRCLADIAG
jgi:tetratricopeptide (TPR) repeat protein